MCVPGCHRSVCATQGIGNHQCRSSTVICMHSPSEAQRAHCVWPTHGKAICSSLEGCLFGRSTLSAHTECSCMHWAALAEAHLVQGVEYEGVSERQNRPGQGSGSICKHNLHSRKPFTEQSASPCKLGSARLRQLKNRTLVGAVPRALLPWRDQNALHETRSLPCAGRVSGGRPTGGPAHRQPISGRG